MFRIAPFRVAAARHPVPRRVRAVHIAGSAVGGGGDTSTWKTQNTSSGSHEKEKTPTHELAVTSTNDIVDAVIRRALRCTDLTNDHEFGDDLEHHGTRHAQDATLLDTLATRWHDLTSSEASDVLHAVGRSPRFGVSALDAQRGALLDTFARQDGPFHTMIEQRPNRHVRRPTKPTDKERSDFKNDLHVPAWRGAPRRNETWHGLPFMYSVSDIARVVFALASFPNSTDQHALVDRSVLAESAAHVTATFSRDAWTRLHASEGDLATLVFSFCEIPGKLSLSVLDDKHQDHSGDDFLHKACRQALKELAHPVQTHHAEFSANEIFTTAMAYQKAYDECWIGVGPCAEGTTESPTAVSPTFADARARAEATLANATAVGECLTRKNKNDSTESTSVPKSDVKHKHTHKINAHTHQTPQTPEFCLSLQDGRASANHVLRALAPEALRRSREFSATQLGYIADACKRFGVHPKGEGTREWNDVVRKRRKEEREEGKGEE